MMSYDFSINNELQLDKICFLADFDLYGDISRLMLATLSVLKSKCGAGI